MRAASRRLAAACSHPCRLWDAPPRGMAGIAGEHPGLDAETERFHKNMGIQVPAPRKASEEAQRLARILRSEDRAPRAGRHARESLKNTTARQSNLQQKRSFAVPSGEGTSVSGAPSAEQEEDPDQEQQDEDEETAQRILDAGSHKLLGTEEGREFLSEHSFDMQSTAKSLLQAGAEELADSDSATSQRATDAAKHMDEGTEDQVAKRVKERTVGIGTTS